jgi:hypothetical protein
MPIAGASPLPDPELNQIEFLLLDGEAFMAGIADSMRESPGREGGLAPAVALTNVVSPDIGARKSYNSSIRFSPENP